MSDFPRCKMCGGFGKGLVRNALGLCTHCTRESKSLFDPAASEWCKNQGFVDISGCADGGILKKILREGTAGETILDGCPAFVQYIGRLPDGSIFDTTRDMVDGKYVGGTDDAFEFQLGVGKVIKGWDIGIATMNKGELSRFIIKPEYAYGADGFPPKVEAFTTLDFEIELIRFGDPLPKFPSKSDLEATRKQQEEENQRLLEQNPPPSIDERVQSASIEKENGNKLIAENNYEEAQKKYDSAFVHLFISKEEWEFLTTQERETISKAKLPLHLNRALCKIKQGNYDGAVWDCDQSIELDNTNVKAHYRRATVYLEKLKQELQKESDGKFWIIEKAEKLAQEANGSLAKVKAFSEDGEKTVARLQSDLHRSEVLLKRYSKQYKEEQKLLFKKKMLDRMDSKNKEHEKKNQAHDVDPFDDMPPLE